MNAMLVLTRKLGEKIHIGANITLTVVEVKGNKVRLGIDAPDKLPIYREELYNLLDKIGVERTESTSRQLATAF
jgi:carbon storage regulator